MSLNSKNKFLQQWEVTRKKGKTKYLLCYTLAWVLFLVLGQVFTFIVHKNSISPLHLSDILIGTGISILLGLLLSYLSWTSNEREYQVIKEQESQQSAQKDDEDGLESAVYAYIEYDNKIYQLTQLDSLSKSLIGEKVPDKAVEVANDYYRINNIDTTKAIALQDGEYGFCKYEYLCDATFRWENKLYKISYSDFALMPGMAQNSSGFQLGKLLGKIENLKIFEAITKDSNKILFVHPDGLTDPSDKDSYFSAVAQ